MHFGDRPPQDGARTIDLPAPAATAAPTPEERLEKQQKLLHRVRRRTSQARDNRRKPNKIKPNVSATAFKRAIVCNPMKRVRPSTTWMPRANVYSWTTASAKPFWPSAAKTLRPGAANHNATHVAVLPRATLSRGVSCAAGGITAPSFDQYQCARNPRTANCRHRTYL